MDYFDLVLLGAGSASEWIWGHLAGKELAVIESGRVGGECPYVACVPSKALLRSAHTRRLLTRAYELGAVAGPLDVGDAAAAFTVAAARRDRVSENRVDSSAVKELDDSGARLYRGSGSIIGDGIVGVYSDGKLLEELRYGTLVINTGSSPKVPDIRGLASVPFWTSEDALSSSELPRSLAILGGGAIGCELADVYSSFGIPVYLIESFDHILPSEDAEVVSILKNALQGYGVNVIEHAKVESVSWDQAEFSLALENHKTISAERLIVATGRGPNVAGIGLETLGITPEPGGIKVDAFCQVVGAKNVYAAGDVTGLAPFTHGANYQARIIVDHINGKAEPAFYGAIPRVVYTEPAVASVGVYPDNASGRFGEIVSVSMDLSSTARAVTDGDEKGLIKLFVDKRRRVLVGASAIGPNVDELISEASLAIQAGISIDLFAKMVHPFPTYSEGFEPPLRQLTV